MAIPRFTAEASLFQSNKHYVLITDTAQHETRLSISPQMRIVSGGCVYHCAVTGFVAAV